MTNGKGLAPSLVFDLRTPLRALTLQEVKEFVDQSVRLPGPAEWIIYVGGRRWDSRQGRVRGKSQIMAFNKLAEPPRLDIVWRNKELIALNKPEGLPTQKTLKQSDENLYDQVRWSMAFAENFPSWLPYVGLHHRLDRDTSGLVLMTLQKSANAGVAELFSQRKIKKTYEAFTEFGQASPPEAEWLFSGPIGRVPGSKQFRFCVSDQGDEALTRFKLIASRVGEWHHFQCEPLTGRTHQIRVHLAHQGWPILGDRVYGRPGSHKPSFPRLYLHAKSLRFTWRGQAVDISCPPQWPIPAL